MPNVLGINLSSFSAAEIRRLLPSWLSEQKQRYIVTPNPEIILAAHGDEELFYILNQADLAPADGFGLRLAGWIYGEDIPRTTGADMVVWLLEDAALAGKKVAVLNWSDGLSKAADIETALLKRFPSLPSLVVDASRGGYIQGLISQDLERLHDFSPDILFCTFGSPYQEKAIYHSLKSLPTVKIAIGCGGAFDFLTGRAIRAPRFFRSMGLEWFWRLIKQPRRWRRIYNAVFVFTVKVLKAKFITRYLYRPNVACLLYKSGTPKQVLIVERSDDPGHWQLPQGGTDGEDIETAGRRELQEESGAVSLVTKGKYKNLHRYDFLWGARNGKLGARDHKYDYRGQKQSLYIAEFLGPDSEIKINFWDHRAWKWVSADQLVETVHPIRRPAASVYVKKLNDIK